MSAHLAKAPDAIVSEEDVATLTDPMQEALGRARRAWDRCLSLANHIMTPGSLYPQDLAPPSQPSATSATLLLPPPR